MRAIMITTRITLAKMKMAAARIPAAAINIRALKASFAIS